MALKAEIPTTGNLAQSEESLRNSRRKSSCFFVVNKSKPIQFRGALHHDRLAIGMSLTGAFGALGNYLVAKNFSEDFWLTYTTFLDLPILIVLFFLVLRWSRKA